MPLLFLRLAVALLALAAFVVFVAYFSCVVALRMYTKALRALRWMKAVGFQSVRTHFACCMNDTVSVMYTALS